MTWQERARCRGLDTNRFYPAEGERDPSRARREERAILLRRPRPKSPSIRYVREPA